MSLNASRTRVSGAFLAIAGACVSCWFPLVADAEFIVASATGWVTCNPTPGFSQASKAKALKTGLILFLFFSGPDRSGGLHVTLLKNQAEIRMAKKRRTRYNRTVDAFRFQEFQFDPGLDPNWLRSRRHKHFVGGRTAHALAELWEREVLSRVRLSEKPAQESQFLAECPPAPITKVNMRLLHTLYRVEIELRAWDGRWHPVLQSCLSQEQANPFLSRGRLPLRNCRDLLPIAVRHVRWSDSRLLHRPEMKCILAGQLPDVKLV
jgi:hypothetical protein